ncbi:hypothetical protein [Peribacillus frigoritolerans]
MLNFIGVVGLLGFIVFLMIGIVFAIKKNGKAKKQFLISVILFVIAFIAIINAPTTDANDSTENKNNSEEEKAAKKEKKEIPPSSVSDVQASIKVNMTDTEYKAAKETINVDFPESLSIGNGNVGHVLEATDGLIMAGTDGEKILFVETFKSMDETKKYAKELYEKAEKEKAEAAEKAEKERAEAEKKAYEKAKIKFSGNGDTATDMMKLKAGYIVVEGSHSGGSNFAVKLQDESGQDLELLVNEIGNYKGKTFAEIPSDGNYYLNVTAGGSWNFEVSQQPPLEMKDIPNKFGGSGDDVIFFNAKSGNYKFSFTHSGSSNFAVKLNGAGLMVNEIGAYNGSMRQPLTTDGYYLLVITADGQWTANIEK